VRSIVGKGTPRTALERGRDSPQVKTTTVTCWSCCVPVDLSQHVDPKSSDQDASKKTEGLELCAVDKLIWIRLGILLLCG
jgi:hypothetical protein